ncbi:hypothetical protein Tcan_10947 [Toxocara canis]|uniref:Uncharacterized protein n=1 Tax=Toxocara canis TaxID=6265 RepID=A0A0B2V6S8_TOXCA|nr:hypothetical protein Tcan_10947 [Toxocara canis]
MSQKDQGQARRLNRSNLSLTRSFLFVPRYQGRLVHDLRKGETSTYCALSVLYLSSPPGLHIIFGYARRASHLSIRHSPLLVVLLSYSLPLLVPMTQTTGATATNATTVAAASTVISSFLIKRTMGRSV